MRSLARLVVCVLAAGLVGCQPAGPDAPAPDPDLVHIEGLGSLSFPSSGNAEAQEPFLRGVLLMHSFEYEPAAEAFREAQEADPGFAMAYWGEAMTYNHPIWQQKDAEAAFEALGRLAPTSEERRDLAGTDREAMYLDAVQALYAEGTKAEQDLAYMQAMQRLQESYPEDLDARAFHALAILGSSHSGRDFATYMRAAATAGPAFEANSDHPGAAHYLIHSFDDPVHAPLGMPAARAYSQIAPNASHAQHMTTHIFVAMGIWDDVISGNIRARDTQDAQLAERGRRPNLCGHYSSWLHYGHLMDGGSEEATELMNACHSRMAQEPAAGARGYFVSMRARHIFDTENWDLAAEWTAELPAGSGPRLQYEFTNAFAALRAGDAEPARDLLVAEPEPDDAFGAIHLDELRGLIAIADGRTDEGIATLQEAARTEDSLPFAFGPPRILKPTFELLGEELLALGRTEEARIAFQRATERTPGRTLAVRGLREASSSAS